MKITRQEQKESTRQHLVETAFNYFANQGFVQTNTASVAKAAKVSHGTLFLHFPTREALIEEVLHEFGNRLAAAFKEKVETKLSLKKILKAHLEVIQEFEDFYSHVVQESRALPSSTQGLFFILHAAVSQKIWLIAQEEMRLHQIKKIERHLLFNTWIALIHYYIANREIFSPHKSIIQEKGQEMLNHFLNLIKY